jgi:hypothetical protein
MTELAPPTPLHLHTIESLCVELVSGRAIGIGNDNLPFLLTSDAARGALDWYRRNKPKWKSPVSVPDAEGIVTTANQIPPVLVAAPTRPSSDGTHKLKLTKIEAHRFAGLHAYGNATSAPSNFVFEPNCPLSLFEGWNGSGKTSLLNSVIWCLTGRLLRPQRPPAAGTEEFECVIDSETEGAEDTAHRLSSVTPLPDPRVYRPADWVAADTWVELTFEDQDGVALSPVRRAQSRTPRGKLEEHTSNFDGLGIDPAGLSVGTTMPGLLQFIQIGSESELGKAITELTGLASLVDLAAHANRTRRKVSVDFTKSREEAIAAADEAYQRAAEDLREAVEKHQSLSDLPSIPKSDAADAEADVEDLVEYIETAKASALRVAQNVLGDAFDPSLKEARTDLEKNTAIALVELQNFGKLDSVMRLSSLTGLAAEDIHGVETKLREIRDEATTLAQLAADPTTAARLRLYARVAAWVEEQPQAPAHLDSCVVCGGDLHDAVDPVTRTRVRQHLDEARDTNADLLSQTIAKWERSAYGSLVGVLPVALQNELHRDLPEHPSGLIKDAISELFDEVAFAGVLQALRADTVAKCDATLRAWSEFDYVPSNWLPEAFDAESELAVSMDRIAKALAFRTWRQAHENEITAFREQVLGRANDAGDQHEESLRSRLKALQEIVQGVEPLNAALGTCKRLADDLAKRKIAKAKIAEFTVAIGGLDELIGLGQLAQDQVEQLRTKLHDRAIVWRDRIYAGAFPSTQHELVDAAMTSGGTLDILVGANGISAPAQHIANASALRASLVGFYLAFWEYVFAERGGLRLVVFDDPQELLDAENRDRLAKTLITLTEEDAQVFVTSYDKTFAAEVAAIGGRTNAVAHHAVLPVTRLRPTAEVPFSVLQIDKLQQDFKDDPDNIEAAKNYASESRTFIEARLADFFDDAAYPATVSFTLKPTFSDHLGRLRGLVRMPPNDLFRSAALKAVAEDAGLVDGAQLLALMNKAHHRKDEIRPNDVLPLVDDILRVRRAVEKAHEASRLWRNRDQLETTQAEIIPLTSWTKPSFTVEIHPDLAAFTRGAAHGDTQGEVEILSGGWFDGKALFYLRNDNFGFAAPSGSIAIVDAEPSAVEDRRLVIARQRDKVFARRLLKSAQSGLLSLAAEPPDPRNSAPTLQVPDRDIALHRVVGVLFDASLFPPIAKTEAVQIPDVPAMHRITTAYRVREDSAIPLALPTQIALGGPPILLSELPTRVGSLVALSLDDGTSVFKRVGQELPHPLQHLRQFESIGGLGESQIYSLDPTQIGVATILHARLIVGVLYHG